MSYKADFSGLGANLSEIIYALKSYATSESLDLYAGSESAVSYQGTWMGKGYKVFNKCVRWIKFDFTAQDTSQTLENIILRQFTDAIKTIYKLKCRYTAIQVKWLEEAIPSLVSNGVYRFRAYLKNENIPLAIIEECDQIFTSETSNKMESIEEIRQSIKSFYSAARLFWSILLYSEYEKLVNPIQRIISKGDLIKENHMFDSLSKLFFTINLEGILRQYIPVTELAKLLSEQQMTAEEVAKTQSWVNKINRNTAKIDPHEFECVLRNIAETVSIAFKIPDSYEKLILKLDALDCRILRMNDRKHIHDRQRLKPGAIVSCNGNQFTLEQLLSPEKANDQIKVFALAHDNSVVKMANNRFRLILDAQKLKSSSEHWGVRHVEIVLNGLDNKGVCVLLERLHNPLSDCVWTCTSPILIEGDRTALILANHLMYWQQSNAVPANLSLNHLMFDSKGKLKSLKLCKKEAADYGKWENFALLASKGNIHVLNFLMRVSKLFEHSVAKYYREPIAKSIEMGSVVPTNVLGNWEEKYKSELLRLSKEACQMGEECFNEIDLMMCDDMNYEAISNTLKQDVFGKLKALYVTSTTAGTVSGSLKETLIAHYGESKCLSLDDFKAQQVKQFKNYTSYCQSQLKKLSLYNFETQQVKQFNEYTSYYQGQFDLMMKYNKSAIEQKDKDDTKGLPPKYTPKYAGK